MKKSVILERPAPGADPRGRLRRSCLVVLPCFAVALLTIPAPLSDAEVSSVVDTQNNAPVSLAGNAGMNQSTQICAISATVEVAARIKIREHPLLDPSAWEAGHWFESVLIPEGPVYA